MSVYDLILNRRTIRKFEQKPITDEMMKKYINAARLAPSAANRQPLKYVGIVSKVKVSEVFDNVKWAGYLAPDYNPKENERPTAFIAVCVDNDISKAGYDMDIGASIENIILTALEDGVGACWMGAIDKPKITEILNLPENLTLSCVVALGFSAETPKDVEMCDGDVKYYLENGTLCVPKRSLDEVILEIV